MHESSQILVESYDKEKNQFLLFELLSSEKKNIIGSELEDIVKKSIEILPNVNTKKAAFFTDSKK